MARSGIDNQDFPTRTGAFIISHDTKPAPIHRFRLEPIIHVGTKSDTGAAPMLVARSTDAPNGQRTVDRRTINSG